MPGPQPNGKRAITEKPRAHMCALQPIQLPERSLLHAIVSRADRCRGRNAPRSGQTNQPPRSQTKTTGEIVRDNICTYFNLVFLVLAVMLALVRSWLNMGFLGIVFWNTLIGIVQQLRAKKDH